VRKIERPIWWESPSVDWVRLNTDAWLVS
jgi:hypothetical protein